MVILIVLLHTGFFGLAVDCANARLSTRPGLTAVPSRVRIRLWERKLGQARML